MNKTVEMLKKQHDARRIEQKDFSIKDLFTLSDKETNKKTKPYQQEDGTVILPVVGFASKYVAKYHKDENPGFHTTIYLKNGHITGSFSTALRDFANYFFEKANMDTEANFNKLMFAAGDEINVRVIKVDLAEGRSTYNFEILDGQINGQAERIGSVGGGQQLIEAASEE